MRAVSGQPIVWSFELDDPEGVPTDADAHTTVDVTVTAGDGTTVIAAGHATDVPIQGIYSFVVPAQTKLDDLGVAATATVGGLTQTFSDVIRVCASRILSPAQIRADPALAKLQRSTALMVLEAVEDLFADALGYPAVLEGTRVNWDAHRGLAGEAFAFGNMQSASPFTGLPGLGYGFGGERLIVPGITKPQQVYGLNINGVDIQDDVVAQFAPGNGYVVWRGGRSWPSANYTMWLSHGLTLMPADLRMAAAKLARYFGKQIPAVGRSDGLIPERTASLTSEGATIVFSVPSADKPTGLPEVDSVLFRYASESVI